MHLPLAIVLLLVGGVLFASIILFCSSSMFTFYVLETIRRILRLSKKVARSEWCALRHGGTEPSMIEVRCSCGAVSHANEEFIGKSLRCTNPACRKLVRIERQQRGVPPKGKQSAELDNLLSTSSPSDLASHFQSEAENMDYLTPKPFDPNARQHACRIPSNSEKDFKIYSPLKAMPENSPQADRELKADELRPGTDVVVMMPASPATRPCGSCSSRTRPCCSQPCRAAAYLAASARMLYRGQAGHNPPCV